MKSFYVVSLWRHPRSLHLPSPVGLVAAAALLGITSFLGCASDATPTAPSIGNGTAYAQLLLNHHAVTLSLTPGYDTAQLVATPLTGTGQPLATSDQVMYTVVNKDTSVYVDSTGLLHARAAANSAVVQVAASLTVNGVTLTDTAQVVIKKLTGAVPLLKIFSIEPPGDTMVIKDSIGFVTTSSTLPLQIVDANGMAINGILVAYRSVDTTIAKVSQVGAVQAVSRPPGASTTIYADVDVYGVSMRDSVRVIVGLPYQFGIAITALSGLGGPSPVLGFSPESLTVAAGAIVSWTNSRGFPPVDVVFVDSLQVESPSSRPLCFGVCFLASAFGTGNIPAFTFDTTLTGSSSRYAGTVFRELPVAGVYRYHSTIYGTSGVLVVQ